MSNEDNSFYRGDARFPETYERGSDAKGAPLDKEGIPFLSANSADSSIGVTMGNIFGRSRPNAKRVPWENDVPHYIERTGRGRRNWYSLGEVKDYVGRLRKSGADENDRAVNEADWGPFHDHLTRVHEGLKRGIEQKRKNGEFVGDFYNQTHRDHKNIHIRMKEGVRTQTIDDPRSPRAGEVLPLKSGVRPSVPNAVKHGFMKPSPSEPPKGN